MKKSILLLVSVFLVMLCSKSTEQANVGQFSNQLTQFPEGITPSNPVQELPGTDAIPAQGVIALKSAWLRHHTQVNTNVYVLGNCTGHGCLDPAEAPANPKAINNANSELTVGVSVTVPAGRVLKADKIRLKNRANVQGTTEANTYAKHNSATIANQVNTLGALPHLPFFLSGTPGTQNVNDATSTLAPGQYRNLTVRKDKLITLAGGFYQFHDIDLKKKSTLLCQTQCFLTVKADVIAEKEITIAATSANPNDFVIYVEGGNAAAEPMAAASKAVQLGGMSHVTANIYAVNGRLQFGAATIAQGAFIGNHVRIEPNSIVTAGPAPVGTVKLFEAGVPGSIEIPGKVRLDVPACALAEDTVISVQPKPDAGANRRNAREWHFYSSRAFDFQPNGLEFACGTALKYYYDAQEVQAQNATAESMLVFNSENDVDYHMQSGVLDPQNQTLTTTTRHFSTWLIGTSDPISHYIYKTAKKGDIIYAGGFGHMTLFNVANPQSPQSIGRYDVPGMGASYYVYGLYAQGNTLFLIINSYGSSTYAAYLVMYDISTSESPVYLRTVQLSTSAWAYGNAATWGNNLQLVGNKIYATVYAYSDGMVRLLVIDVANQTSPTVTAALPISGGGYYISVQQSMPGTYIYRSTGLYGLDVIDASNMTRVGNIPTPSTGYFASMTRYGRYALPDPINYLASTQYVSGKYQLVLTELSNPYTAVSERIYDLNQYATPGRNYQAYTLLNEGSNFFHIITYGWDGTNSYNGIFRLSDVFTPTLLRQEIREYNVQTELNHLTMWDGLYLPNIAYLSAQNRIRAYVFDDSEVLANGTPNDGEASVSVFSPISVQFNAVMNSASLVATTTTTCQGSIQVSQDNFATCVPMVSSVAEMSLDGRIATFKPQQLEFSKTYKIKVTRDAVSAGLPHYLRNEYVQSVGFSTSPMPAGQQAFYAYDLTNPTVGPGRLGRRVIATQNLAYIGGASGNGGAIAVYAMNGSGIWNFEQVITPPVGYRFQDGNYQSWFAASGDLLAVRGLLAGIDTHVFVYKRSGNGSYALIADLQNPVAAGRQFARGIAISGNELVISEIQNTNTDPDMNYLVYDIANDHSSVSLRQTINMFDSFFSGQFCASRSVDRIEIGDDFFVATQNTQGSATGCATVVSKNSSFNYNAGQTVTGFAGSGTLGFMSLAVQGNLIAAGAPLSHFFGPQTITNAGKVVLFNKSGGYWGAIAEISNPDPQNFDQFGSDLAFSGSKLLVGVPGKGTSLGFGDSNYLRGQLNVFDVSNPVAPISLGPQQHSISGDGMDGAKLDEYCNSIASAFGFAICTAPGTFYRINGTARQGAVYFFPIP